MERKYFEISADDKVTVTTAIKDCLTKRKDLLFAYIHGSFVMANRFRDIDVAVYLNKTSFLPLEIELELEAELGELIRSYPVEVRTLNSAPVSFRYSVIKQGKPVVVADDDARAEFEVAALSNYFDFLPFHKMYLKESLGLGI